jgi:hypothetical protein
MSDDVPLTFFRIAGVGLGAYVMCNFLLRRTLASDSDVFQELFTQPIFGSITGAPGQLRAKYFLPWAPSPEFLDEESPWVRVWFWGARLGGTLLFVAIAGFLASEVYIGTIGHHDA